MNLKTSLTKILSQPVNRGEFLRGVGAAILVLFGITAMLDRLGIGEISRRQSNQSYGGNQSRRRG